MKRDIWFIDHNGNHHWVGTYKRQNTFYVFTRDGRKFPKDRVIIGDSPNAGIAHA